ncbi:MAG: hypothetical protein M9962_10855 [Oligoflexia bacterium]|nr:hypothetical protein [Oligoflexia bacterium]
MFLVFLTIGSLLLISFLSAVAKEKYNSKYREWLLVFFSLVSLRLLAVDTVSYLLLIFTLAIHWFFILRSYFKIGILFQLLFLFGLKILIACNLFPFTSFPIGFSYYSLAVISLHIDALRNKKKTLNFSEFFLFLSYWPKFFAGPIERHDVFLRELRKRRPMRWRIIFTAFQLVLWGAFKKFCIADPIWRVVEANLFKDDASSFMIFYSGLIALAIHFYAEFSGYVDMARGISRIMGIRLSINFRAPFLATNPQDFWQRWHISLSNWLRDYIHYPVFFKTKLIWLSIFSSFVFMGAWHGLELNYLIVGLYWAVLMFLYSQLKPWLRRPRQLFGHFWLFMSVFTMFHLSCISFLILYSNRWWKILSILDFSSLDWTPYVSQSILRVAFFIFPFFLKKSFFPHYVKVACFFFICFLIFFFQEESARNIKFMYFQF